MQGARRDLAGGWVAATIATMGQEIRRKRIKRFKQKNFQKRANNTVIEIQFAGMEMSNRHKRRPLKS